MKGSAPVKATKSESLENAETACSYMFSLISANKRISFLALAKISPSVRVYSSHSLTNVSKSSFASLLPMN